MFVQYLYTCKVHLKDGRLNKYKKVFVRSMLIFHHFFAGFFKIILQNNLENSNDKTWSPPGAIAKQHKKPF
jgi:hypothetical protein